VKITLEDFPLLDDNIYGDWISSKASSITIDKEFLIEHRKNQVDSIRIKTLSPKGLVAVINKSNRKKPFLLDIKEINPDSIEITNLRTRNVKDRSLRYARKVELE